MSTLCLHDNHPTKVVIHSIPFKIKYDGKANISDYFIPNEGGSELANGCGINGSIVDNKLDQNKYSFNNKTHCYFRGRALLKNIVKFDDGICGYKLKKTETADNTQNVYETIGVFDNINVWQLTNRKRTKYENTINNWFKISSAIHDTVTPEAESTMNE